MRLCCLACLLRQLLAVVVRVGLSRVVQVLRPRMGHGSDTGGRRTPWILGGMAVLIGVFSFMAPVLLNTGEVGSTMFLLLGFVLLGERLAPLAMAGFALSAAAVCVAAAKR